MKKSKINKRTAALPKSYVFLVDVLIDHLWLKHDEEVV